MKQTKNIRQIRRRLMTGIFCISLFAADLASAVPVWAKEPVEAEEQVQEAGEEGTGETQNPADGNQEGTVQNPDRENEGEGGGSQTQNPEEGNGGDDAQKPDEGKDGDDAQDPDEGKDGDNEQNPDEGKDGEGEQNPEDEKDGDGVTDDTDVAEQEPETPDGGETPGTDDQESVSENDPDEQEPSVSENDVEALGEVRALAVPADAIASGSYENITWVIDANGKLTVEGTGEFAVKVTSGLRRAPWWTNGFNGEIKSAEVRVTGMTDVSYMFDGCHELETVSFVGTDTSTVTNMGHMFSGCDKLRSINFGEKFDTSSVTNMTSMFIGCETLQSISVKFDTSNVTDMSNMFHGCQGSVLKSVNVTDFDTGNVTDMSGMFYGCRAVGDLDLSGWDTSKVTKMDSMFCDCDYDCLTLGGRFTTQSAKSLNQMFGWYNNDPGKTGYVKLSADRIKLKGIDLGWLDLSSEPILAGIFCGCDVKELNLSRLDTSVTTELIGLFSGCDMTGVDFSDLKTDTITNMQSMFRDCEGTIDLRTLAHENVTNMDSMFGVFSNSGEAAPKKNRLKSLDVSVLDTSKVTNMATMFLDQDELTSLDLSGFDVGKVKTVTRMFEGCSSLKTLNLSGWNIDVRYVTDMVSGCTSLTSLDLSGFNFDNVGTQNIKTGIDTCNSLATLYTPYNVKGTVSLPTGDWYMADGTKLEDNCLPKNLPYSVLIKKGSKPSVSEVHMEVSKKKTLYGCGEAINTDDLTVTYYGADGSVRKLAASDGQTDGYTTNAASLSTAQPGTLELVVTYTKDGKTLTEKITLTVAHILTADNTTVTLPAEDYTYDGQPKQPVPTAVSYTQNAAGGAGTPVTLSEGTDYTISYRNNINAYEPSAADGSGAASGTGTGTAAPTIIIKGAGKYSGSVTKTFAIQKAASPAAETMDVTGSQCTQAQPKRTADLTGSFTACGKKTGYEILSVEDPKGIFAKEPATADIRDGVLTYGTKAAQAGDTASLKVKVSFANYRDAELTVRITMAAKKAAVISGITMEESVVYSGAPVSYGGEAAVKTEDGKDITGQVSLVYQYSGTMADGTAYPAQGGTAEPPVNAGNYVLTVSVSDDDPDYTGSVSYPFTIKKAEAKVQAKDLPVPMQSTQGGSALIPVEQYQKDFGYTVTGLQNADTLRKGPAYTVTEDEAGTRTVTAIDTSKAGTYYIHPSGADAGMNYELTYRPGILTVSEERVAYTVTLDGMGHCDTFTKSGIKSGALLELTEAERTPAAKEKGYVFAGWFKDRTFDKGKEWSFDTDTVQSDLTLYACWLTAADKDGAGLKLCVQEIPDLTYTGNAWKPAVTVYDSDGTTLLKAGKDYTVKYVRNTDAVAVDENGKAKEAGGTAKVTNPGKANEQLTDVAGHFSKNCPYVVITGKGNYAETIYRNFLILPAQISADAEGKTESGNLADGGDDTPLAAGFTMKYTDQFEAKAGRTAKIVSSIKYKKTLKEGKDYSVSVADGSGQNVALTQGKLPLNAGSYTMTVTGKGNYTGVVTRRLYVAEKQKLMKNVSIVLGKNQKTRAYTGEDVLLTPGYYDADTKKNHEVTPEGVVDRTKETNAADMFLVKAGKESLVWGKDYTIDYAGTNRAVGTATMTLTGKDGYVGKKSVTFQITGTPFSAKTIGVKAYDGTEPGDPQGDAFRNAMSYTGRAVTQNKVTLTTKVTPKNPEAQTLTYGEHYTIAYKNNVKKGTATVIFTAKPESGYSGSFKKTFKITAQELSKERLTITPQGRDMAASGETVRTGAAGQTAAPEAVYCKNGAKLPFVITNEVGTVLREGTDYTVRYKNNNAVTTAQTPENKKPLMTVTGKGNYAGKVEVPFAIVQVSLADALENGTVTVSCAQVQKKDGMKVKDFKLKVMDGKAVLKAGVDYTVDETGCTPEIIRAYADALGTAGTAPEPKLVLTGTGNYGAKAAAGETAGGQKEISLADYIYVTKLTAKNLKAEVTGDRTYTGRNTEPTVKVSYYKDNNAAKQDAVGVELTEGKDYQVTYGVKNIPAGKKKGSITITGAGVYGGSVTVKFDIEKKAIY